MDDRLEKFIKSHRAEMDGKNPGKNLWADIEKELNQSANQKHITRPVIIWRAAAVILLLITSWLAFDKVYQNQEGNESYEVTEVSPQLLEAETFYISLINQKRGEIKIMIEKHDPGNDFLNEIDKLDSMYAILKQDMKNGNKANLIDAMILNLQLRIEILNQQLKIIQSIENSQKDEKVIL